MKRRDTGVRDDKGRRIREGDVVVEYGYDYGDAPSSGKLWARYTVRHGRYVTCGGVCHGFFKDRGDYQHSFPGAPESRLIDR